ncbi:MAG: heme-binding protein [Alphaproteobacteria bacterium]|nr:heme-binding protein [Alphaproteobacteria bacterium]
MMKPIIITVSVVAIVAGILSLAWSILGSEAEHARYDVVETQGDIEIRSYPPMIVAEVDASGPREVSIKEGFRSLAGYIFGDNQATGKIAMTAPVMQQPASPSKAEKTASEKIASEKIAMTAPVMQQSKGSNWTITFMMPSQYKLADLPVPNNSKIRMREQGEKRFAVIRYSGRATPEVMAEKEAKLQDYVNSKSLKRVAEPVYAFFNPPYTLPFLRRNEIMIEIKK